jgi:hypothetical protein
MFLIPSWRIVPETQKTQEIICKNNCKKIVDAAKGILYKGDMKHRNIVPRKGSGRPAACDWKNMLIGDSVVAKSGSAHYWNRQLQPKHFCVRGDRVYRSR